MHTIFPLMIFRCRVGLSPFLCPFWSFVHPLDYSGTPHIQLLPCSHQASHHPIIPTFNLDFWPRASSNSAINPCASSIQQFCLKYFDPELELWPFRDPSLFLNHPSSLRLVWATGPTRSFFHPAVLPEGLWPSLVPLPSSCLNLDVYTGALIVHVFTTTCTFICWKIDLIFAYRVCWVHRCHSDRKMPWTCGW